MPFHEALAVVTMRQLRLTLRETAVTRGRWIQVGLRVIRGDIRCSCWALRTYRSCCWRCWTHRGQWFKNSHAWLQVTVMALVIGSTFWMLGNTQVRAQFLQILFVYKVASSNVLSTLATSDTSAAG